ncbi:MAG: SigmaK-factor processing regulatory BofA [Clostridiales bacterium]|nr:SigmaK-factor processing regulatory BofA [Clostridiales bacterium]
MPLQLIGIIALVVLVFLLFPLFKLLRTPIKWAFKLLLNAAFGFIALIVLNFFGSLVGLHIAISWLSAILVGVLGLPGVILLLLVQYIF